MHIYKIQVVPHLQITILKIEKWILRLQKETETFWCLEKNAYLCKKLVKTRKIVS